MARFMGEFIQVMDAKNRIFIPAKYREIMSDTVYITVNLDGCLSGYSAEDFDKFYDKIMEYDAENGTDLARDIFPNTNEVKPDGQGRVVITPSLKAHAKLEKDIYVIGVGNHFEIWDKATRDEMIANRDSSVKRPRIF